MFSKRWRVRKFWLKQMCHIINPVLENLSKKQLKQTFPVFNEHKAHDATQEAFARTVCGISPWLELDAKDSYEKRLQDKYRNLVLTSLDFSVDPSSPEFMDWTKHNALVEAAFLCQGLLRSPKQLLHKVEGQTKKNLVNALKATRAIKPGNNNWILFSAMVEAGLFAFGQDYRMDVLKDAVNKAMSWYKGDGVYGDGAELHCDYYNSFVIQPMLVDIVSNPVIDEIANSFTQIKTLIRNRSKRYAFLLERLIAPDGTYPIIGRSITYRFGAFQMLAQAASLHMLDGGRGGGQKYSISPSQVRCCLTQVIKKTMKANIFDKKGFLLCGIVSNQPSLAEFYINIGSLYLCTTVFLPLGLPFSDSFWSDPDEKWTSQKVFSGADLEADEALKST